MHNYFAVLGLPPTFDLDTGDLEKRYFSEQRRFHPDRLTGRNSSERQKAITQSMLVNEAYETLKSPLRRALHLLALHGLTQDSLKPSQELLMEIIELREALTATHTQRDLEKFAQQGETAKQAALATLADAFARSDMPSAAEIATRLSYLMKIEDEIRVRRKAVSA